MHIKITLTILGMIVGIATTGLVTALTTTTQEAEAKVNDCSRDGNPCTAGGTGGRDNLVGIDGQGGRGAHSQGGTIEGGGGGQFGSCDGTGECLVGGTGGQAECDETGNCDRVGGSGEHPK